MKKYDALLIAFFLLIAIVILIWIYVPSNEVALGEAIIYKDGHEYASVPLSVERIIIVEDRNGGRNVISIKNGQVEMMEASCKDQICVHTRPAKKNGQSIICLPNKVIVDVKSTKSNNIDGVSE